MRTIIILTLLLGTALGQVCTAGLQLQNDNLPANPVGNQNVAVIQGFCVGDKAAAVFDLSSYGGAVDVTDCGILFAGPPGSQNAGGAVEVYDGVSFAPNGAATLGPLLYVSPPLTWNVNAVNVFHLPAPVTINSGLLVAAFTMASNPNTILGCLTGYTASFCSDTNLPPGSPCATPPGRNLIFDPSQGWWDITGFTIGGTPWCGAAFNGNWVIRVCIDPPFPNPYPGTGGDLVLSSTLNSSPLDLNPTKTANPGDLLTLRVDSPGASFVGVELLLLLEVFPTGTPVPPIFPGIVISGNNPAFLLTGSGGPLGSPVLPPFGYYASFTTPSGLAATSGLFQGIVTTPAAANMIFESTDGHEIQFQ